MIIIPTYNERKNIRPLVGRIRAVLPELPILFVDDNSPDGTSDEIKSLQLEDANISLLTRPDKSGFASAYLDGFRLALVGNVDLVITMDADLSHPPEKLPEMIAAANLGMVAIGSRYVDGGSVKNWKLRRRVLSKFANFYARVLTKLNARDSTAGFLAMSADKLKNLDLTKIQSRGYAFLVELKVHLDRAGHQFSEVPIVFEERKEGESKIGRAIILEGIKFPLKLWFDRQWRQNYVPWLIFFVTFAVYACTLPHTIFFGDSPEFMASVATLGIPHPPGYPGYLLLAKPFTWLPFGSLEFRIGLFSALSASLCLVVIFHLLKKFIKTEWLAAVSVLIFGFTNIYWSQAIMAKVYIPMLLVLFLILLLLDKFLVRGKKSYLLMSLFLWGYGITIHEILVLFFPVLFFFLFLKAWKQKQIFGSFFRQKVDMKTIIAGILLFLLGLSAFLYLPLRAGNPSVYDFSRVFRVAHPDANIEQFLNYVKRAPYQDFGPGFDLKNKVNFITAFANDNWRQFNILLIVAVIGLVQLLLTNKKYFIIFLSIFVLNSLGIIFTRNSLWGAENDYLYSFYYLPAYAVCAIWIGIGLGRIFDELKQRFTDKFSMRFLIIIAILPVLFFYTNLKTNNLSHFTFIDDYTTKILDSLPPNAALLIDYENASSDTMIFGLHFKQIAAKTRPDVALLTIYDVYPQVDYNIVAGVFGFGNLKTARYYLVKYMSQQSQFKDRPIYTTFIVDDLSDRAPNWFSSSNGLIYKFYDNQPKNFINDQQNITMDYQKDQTILETDIYGRALLMQYFYAQAGWFVENKQISDTTKNIIEGIKYDDRLKVDNASIRAHRTRVLGAEKI